MNFIKAKKIITILMFAAHASACYAAAQPAQRSWWQRTKNFVAEHPISTGVIGSVVAVGAYELTARSLGLPSITDVDLQERLSTDLKNIRADKLAYIGLLVLGGAGSYYGTQYVMDVADSRSGEYPRIVKAACDYAAEHPIASIAVSSGMLMGMGLGYEKARQLGLPPAYDLLKSAGSAFVDQAKKDLIFGAPASDTKPSIPDHFLHGARLLGYRLFLTAALNYSAVIVSAIITSPEELMQIFSSAAEASKETASMLPWHELIILIPLYEEALYTYAPCLLEKVLHAYVPHPILNNKAQMIMPILFALGHQQYNTWGKIMTGTLNIVNHRSLLARQEYMFGPLIAHMLNNALAFGLIKLSR